MTLEDNLSLIPLELILGEFLSSFKGSTRKCYRSRFDKLFLNEIIHRKWSLKEFIEVEHSNIIEIINSCSFLTDSLKNGCITAYSSFGNYVSKQFHVEINTGNAKKNTFITNHKNSPLTEYEWEKFIIALRRINPRDALIAEVLNYANGFLNIRYRGISLIDVLALQVSWISDNGHQVSFWRKRHNLQGVIIFFPDRLLKSLRELCRKSMDYVFTTFKGKPVRENQIKRSFANASDKACIRRITPAIVHLPVENLDYSSYFEKECVCI